MTVSLHRCHSTYHITVEPICRAVSLYWGMMVTLHACRSDRIFRGHETTAADLWTLPPPTVFYERDMLHCRTELSLPLTAIILESSEVKVRAAGADTVAPFALTHAAVSCPGGCICDKNSIIQQHLFLCTVYLPRGRH